MAVLLVLNGKLALKCDYEERYRAKEVPGARWNPEMKVWEYPLNEAIVTQITQIFPHAKVSGEIRARRHRNPRRATCLSLTVRNTIRHLRACGLAGYDIALTRRRSPVRIRSGPSIFWESELYSFLVLEDRLIQ